MSSRRIAALLAAPVILIACAVYATTTIERNAALLSAREQTTSQILLTAMLDQETGARGFFQTRRREFLQPWTRGTGSFSSSVRELRSLLQGDADLRRMLADQAQRAAAWHTSTAAAIFTLERTGHSQSSVSALQAKGVMDSFRAAHSSFDAALTQRSNSNLSAASAIAVTVAIALVALLTFGGLALARRISRHDAMRQHDKSELRELLQASDSEHESRDLLIRHIQKLLPGATAAVFNRNNSDDRLEITVDSGDARLDRARISQMRPRACMAVRLSRTYGRGPGEENLIRCEICGKTDGTSVCEPLLVGGQVIGSVLVASGKSIDADRRARLQDSVAQAAPILANQRNLALAERRAASDALTGLPNRRSADETLKRMAAHAGRSLTPLASILLDLDHFKDLNDRHGHESGDKALAQVGSIIKSAIRSSDFAARFGGEEFLILLPETDHEAAAIVAEKLRQQIADAELPGIGPISASLGIAVLPTDAGEVDELLRKTDRSLYAAKEGGRNRVHAFSQSSVLAD